MDDVSVLRELTELDQWLEGITPEPIIRVIEKIPFNAPIPIYLCFASIMLFGVVAFVFKRRSRNRHNCKWRKTKTQTVVSLTQYECKTCGVEAFTANGKPPKDCKRSLKARPL